MNVRMTNHESQITSTLWRWILRFLRSAIWVADEWVHAQEVKLRDTSHESPGTSHEYDVDASRERERAIKKSQRTRAARVRTPRLKYAHGEFVRQ